jgi:thiamine pyrophosphokinase
MQAFIFLNGGLSDPVFYRDHYGRNRTEGDVVVCADGGYALAASLGIAPDVIAGDLDSIGGEAPPSGVRLVRHPPEKDFSDFEIALQEAKKMRAGRITVYGALGGRADHELINLVILAHAGLPAVFVEEGTEAHNVIRELVLDGRRGWTCSLAALGGACRGVRTEGLLYPLRDELLEPSSRGLSNLVVGETARVRVQSGRLLAVLIKPSPAGPASRTRP